MKHFIDAKKTKNYNKAIHSLLTKYTLKKEYPAFVNNYKIGLEALEEELIENENIEEVTNDESTSDIFNFDDFDFNEDKESEEADLVNDTDFSSSLEEETGEDEVLEDTEIGNTLQTINTPREATNLMEILSFDLNVFRKNYVEAYDKHYKQFVDYTGDFRKNDGYEINIDKPYAIIVGNEGAGVSDEVASYATNTIYIPMNDKCESLNVSIATSIILYEFSRK